LGKSLLRSKNEIIMTNDAKDKNNIKISFSSTPFQPESLYTVSSEVFFFGRTDSQIRELEQF